MVDIRPRDQRHVVKNMSPCHDKIDYKGNYPCRSRWEPAVLRVQSLENNPCFFSEYTLEFVEYLQKNQDRS